MKNPPMKTPLSAHLLGAALLFFAPAAVAAGTDVAAEPSLAIAAAHVLLEGDVVMDDALVLIGDGRVLAVGKQADLAAKLPKGVAVVHHDGWLSAGLVAANGTMGLAADDDSTDAFMEQLQLVLAFDPSSKSLSAARNLGVTSFGLVSGRFNVIGGVGAVVKTDGSVLDPMGNLSICLAPPALRGNRFPTSYAGALMALRERIAGGEGPLAAAASGKNTLPVNIAVNSRAEIARAIEFATESKLKATLRGAQRAGEFAADLKAAKISVALAPLGLGSSHQARESMLELAKAGVPFAFGLADTGGSAAVLRESAALAVRAGLDRATAWRAVTSTAADIIGAGDRVGRVAAGFDADLVLWSGDPLSITSRPVAVYLNGELTEGATR